MPKGRRKQAKQLDQTEARSYRHTEADSPLRPDVGTQAQFRKKKPPATYRYDSSLSPALDWDSRNPAREQGEALIHEILEAGTIEQARAAAEKLKSLSRPFLNWTGKAERLSFDVPTLPLFVHERLSTKGIIETLTGHRKDKGAEQLGMFELFGDPQRPVTDQVLKAYEYRDKWVNRMVLGDSLVAMNSLLHYEGMGGQVQMIYFDPPYGIKFGSNFQPFIRKRDVTHNDDEDMTREPEMVKAYRDTWEVGLHSYLTYMRDRLHIARELLSPSGSIFVQISDENLHHVREIMGEVFGVENFQSQISFQKSGGSTDKRIEQTVDYILWYSKDFERLKFKKLISPKRDKKNFDRDYCYVEAPSGKEFRKLTQEEIADPTKFPDGWKRFRLSPCNSQHYSATRSLPYVFNGTTVLPGKDRQWSVSYD